MEKAIARRGFQFIWLTQGTPTETTRSRNNSIEGHPDIFNSDQGAQFTAHPFTDHLLTAGIRISHDGRGRYLDNIFVERLWRTIKYEDIYLKGYTTVQELRIGLTDYFNFYNHKRPHQSLNNLTPATVYQGGLTV